MPIRSYLAAGLVACSVGLLVAAPSRAQETQARGSKITISKATLSPTKVSGSGGSVSIRVRITVKGGSVTTATARAKLKGVNGPVANLQPSGTGIFAGTVSVPRNTGRKALQADITVTANTTRGSATKKVGKVLVDKPGGDPAAPPPPPNI